MAASRDTSLTLPTPPCTGQSCSPTLAALKAAVPFATVYDPPSQPLQAGASLNLTCIPGAWAAVSAPRVTCSAGGVWQSSGGLCYCAQGFQAGPDFTCVPKGNTCGIFGLCSGESTLLSFFPGMLTTAAACGGAPTLGSGMQCSDNDGGIYCPGATLYGVGMPCPGSGLMNLCFSANWKQDVAGGGNVVFATLADNATDFAVRAAAPCSGSTCADWSASANSTTLGFKCISVGCASGQYVSVVEQESAMCLYATYSNPSTPSANTPVAAPDSATTPSGAPVVVRVLDNDSDADNAGNTNVGLTLQPIGSAVYSPVGCGVAVVNAGSTNVTFTPSSGFSGVCSFSYVCQDSDKIRIAIGNASVTVMPPPPPPSPSPPPPPPGEPSCARVTCQRAAPHPATAISPPSMPWTPLQRVVARCMRIKLFQAFNHAPN